MIIKSVEEYRFSRRQVLSFGGAALLVLSPLGAAASPAKAKERLAQLTRGAELQKGHVAIDLPNLTQDGKRTRIKVSVDCPMNEECYVKALHILAERNTVPNVATYHFTPISGVAEITMRIRVAKSQTIIAAAELNDGSVYYAKARCKVARGAGGCG